MSQTGHKTSYVIVGIAALAATAALVATLGDSSSSAQEGRAPAADAPAADATAPTEVPRPAPASPAQDRESDTTVQYPEPGPLPNLEAPDPALAELGRMLFFDVRLSGDATMSCATCHDPAQGWADGAALSVAYPGSNGFRNTRTILNSVHARYFYWDGRLSGRDRPTMVRDHITESHFLNLDGRLMLERLKQVPEYVERFNATQGGEPSFGRTLNAVAAFVETLVSRNVPFDRGRMSASARRGYELFRGRAGCVQCHNGSYFSDARPHVTGVPTHPELTGDPIRHFTMRAFMAFMGVPNFENIREDPGYFIVSKEERHRGAWVTPTLRELTRTAPYMHNGMLTTLEEVIDFYDAGGGDVSNRSELLRPLELSDAEKADLVAFLESLSGDEITMEAPELPEYQLIENWLETPN